MPAFRCRPRLTGCLKAPLDLIPDAALTDSPPADPKLDRAIQTRIGDQLRAMYDDLMQQPMTDKLKELLTQLEQPGQEKSQ